MTAWLREWRFKRNHLRACRKLAAHREKNLASFEIQDFRKRRAAALKGRR